VGATLPLAASWNGGLTRRLTLFAALPQLTVLSQETLNPTVGGERRIDERCRAVQ